MPNRRDTAMIVDLESADNPLIIAMQYTGLNMLAKTDGLGRNPVCGAKVTVYYQTVIFSLRLPNYNMQPISVNHNDIPGEKRIFFGVADHIAAPFGTAQDFRIGVPVRQGFHHGIALCVVKVKNKG